MNTTSLSVFDFRDYKSYLKAWIKSQRRHGHGEKTRIVEAIHCHSGYVSQVIEGNAHFSAEQVALLNRYLEHNKDESRFLLLLLQHTRAGNEALREHFQILIQELLDRHNLLRNRPDFRKTIPQEQQAIYYSAWYYTAVHTLLSIPEFQSRDAISKRLALKSAKVADVLEFLVSAGLATDLGGGRFKPGLTGIHIGDNSPFAQKHHSNWRIKAIDSLDQLEPDELHFSSVGSVGRKDLPRLRAIMTKAIEEIRATLKDSPDEILFCYNLDLFRPS